MQKTFLFLFVLGFVWAQKPDEKPKRSFVAKQEAMLALLQQQIPRLEQVEKQVNAAWARVQAISEQARYPSRIHLIKDTAMIAIAQVRRIADKAEQTVKDLFFEWFYKSWDLMAVYTRYGELMAQDTIDQSLKTFLIEYRKYLRLNERILKTIKDIRNETDFLLASKFN